MHIQTLDRQWCQACTVLRVSALSALQWRKSILSSINGAHPEPAWSEVLQPCCKKQSPDTKNRVCCPSSKRHGVTKFKAFVDSNVKMPALHRCSMQTECIALSALMGNSKCEWKFGASHALILVPIYTPRPLFAQITFSTIKNRAFLLCLSRCLDNSTHRIWTQYRRRLPNAQNLHFNMLVKPFKRKPFWGEWSLLSEQSHRTGFFLICANMSVSPFVETTRCV
jgi:hypothetical protein